MLPWIVSKFMILAVFLTAGVGALILINVYDVFKGDTSLAIAVGVIVAAFLGKDRKLIQVIQQIQAHESNGLNALQGHCIM